MGHDKASSEKDEERLRKLVAAYSGQKWSLIPLVQEIQKEFGYIPPPAIPVIAAGLKLFPSQVQGVVSFYEQLYTEPRGKNIVRVCRGTACHVRGGKTILKQVMRQLNLEENQTSEDLEYTLETVACLGVCALSPTMTINGRVYGHMNPKKLKILFKAGGEGQE